VTLIHTTPKLSDDVMAPPWHRSNETKRKTEKSLDRVAGVPDDARLSAADEMVEWNGMEGWMDDRRKKTICMR